jgi:tetratricopeptide (TPR) repeat protein
LFAQDTKALLQEAKTIFEAQKFDEAIAKLNPIIEREPSNEEALTYRARAFIILKKVPEASADADKILTINPKNTFALNVRGMVKGANKDFKGAVADFTQAVTLDPKFFRAYYQRARAKEFLNESLSSILADYDLAYKYSNEDISFLEYAGNACLDKNGSAETCAAYYSKYKTKKPDSAFGYLGIALSYANNFSQISDKSIFQSKIIPEFRKAIELNPKDEVAPLNLGKLFLRLKNYQESIIFLDKAITNNPKRAWTFAMRGEANFSLENYDAAIADYSKALEIDPKYQSVYQWRAKARDKKGEKTPVGYKTDADKTFWEETLNDFKKAAELSNQDYDTYNELDNFVFSLARFAASQQKNPTLEKQMDGQKDDFYKSLIQANPKNVCARYFLWQNTTYFENREAWDALINNYDGKNGSKCAGSAALWIGRVYAEGDRYRGIAANPTKAQEYYEMVLKFEPQNPYVQNWIAQLPKELKGTPVTGSSTGSTEEFYERKMNPLRFSIKRGLEYDKMNALEKIDAERLARDMVELGNLMKKALEDPNLNNLYRIGYIADMEENNKQLQRIMKRYKLGKYNNGDDDGDDEP